jgi:hypothetical protein
MLDVWSVAAVAASKPGYYEELAAAHNGTAVTAPAAEAIPDWAGRVAAVKDHRR